MEQLLRGLLYGLIFFFAGYMLFTRQDIIMQRMASSAYLPVIEKLSRDFKTGVELAGRDFRVFVEKELGDRDIQQLLGRRTPWAWQRTDIENKLAQHFGKKQAEKRQLFLNYIEQYAPLALSEMAASGIPASVTLAQGILETNAGNSYIARTANNHFAIKCYKRKDYKADGIIDDRDFYHHELAHGCVQIHDDHAWDRFHMYQSPALSFRHHTLLLSREPRYNWMLRAYGDKIGAYCQVEPHWFGTPEVPYYAAWCIGLKKSGYATSKTYAQKLAYIIETYELWRFDYLLVG